MSPTPVQSPPPAVTAPAAGERRKGVRRSRRGPGAGGPATVTGAPAGETNESLCALYRGGDRSALDRLVARNHPFVRMRANRYKERYPQFIGDLESEGLQGICKAADRFSIVHGANFLTYAAFWIDQKIRRWLANNGRTVRLPVHVGQIVHRVLLAEEVLLERFGREASIEEVAVESRLSVARVRNARRAAESVTLSLDTPLGEEPGSHTFYESVADTQAADPAAETLREDQWSLLRRALHLMGTTEPVWTEVLQERFGLNAEGRSRTLEEIGHARKVTRERIRQIEVQAKARMQTLIRRLEREGFHGEAPPPVVVLPAAGPRVPYVEPVPRPMPRPAPPLPWTGPVPARPTPIPAPSPPNPTVAGGPEEVAGRFTPRTDQREAIQAAVEHLAVHRRGNILAFCGTGKTLLALWISERIAPQGNTILLCPSLALIDQSLRAWRRHGSMPSRYLCLCSENELKLAHQDRADGSPLEGVTTDPAVVEDFLRGGEEDDGGPRRVLMGTYQSSGTLREVLTRARARLCIYDEAHTTACGQGESLFAGTLVEPAEHAHDRAADTARGPAVGIDRRLFLSATPRLFRRGADGLPHAFSMDNEATYGARIYTLNARKAIDLGIIRPYRVCLVVCRTPALSGGVGSPRHGVDPEAAARALALAMRAYGVEKAIAFYGRVDHARQAVEALKRGDEAAGRLTGDQALPPLRVGHVHGKMKRTERERNVALLRAPGRAVVTNAFLMGTGMDLPDVRLVGIMEPRRSTESVIQYTGRALRRPAGEAAGVCAYLFVPVFVPADQSVAEAAAGAGFAQALAVISALGQVDPLLALGLAVQGNPAHAPAGGGRFTRTVSTLAADADDPHRAEAEARSALPILLTQAGPGPHEGSRRWTTADLEEAGRIAFLEEAVREGLATRPSDDLPAPASRPAQDVGGVRTGTSESTPFADEPELEWTLATWRKVAWEHGGRLELLEHPGMEGRLRNRLANFGWWLGRGVEGGRLRADAAARAASVGLGGGVPGETPARWAFALGLTHLRQYADAHGGDLPPQTHVTDAGFALGRWFYGNWRTLLAERGFHRPEDIAAGGFRDRPRRLVPERRRLLLAQLRFPDPAHSEPAHVALILARAEWLGSFGEGMRARRIALAEHRDFDAQTVGGREYKSLAAWERTVRLGWAELTDWERAALRAAGFDPARDPRHPLHLRGYLRRGLAMFLEHRAVGDEEGARKSGGRQLAGWLDYVAQRADDLDAEFRQSLEDAGVLLPKPAAAAAAAAAVSTTPRTGSRTTRTRPAPAEMPPFVLKDERTGGLAPAWRLPAAHEQTVAPASAGELSRVGADEALVARGNVPAALTGAVARMVRGISARVVCQGCGRFHFTTEAGRSDPELLARRARMPDRFLRHGDSANVTACHFGDARWLVMRCPCGEAVRQAQRPAEGESSQEDRSEGATLLTADARAVVRRAASQPRPYVHGTGSFTNIQGRIARVSAALKKDAWVTLETLARQEGTSQKTISRVLNYLRRCLNWKWEFRLRHGYRLVKAGRAPGTDANAGT